MAHTVNELWQDALIRHQIGLTRLSGSIRNQIIAILNATEADLSDAIRNRLSRVALSTAGTQRLQILERLIQEIRGSAFTEIGASLRADMLALSKSEVAFLASSFATVSPVLLATSLPAPDLLRNIVIRQPFQGRLLKTWVADMSRTDQKRIMDQIRIGMVQGEGVATIARRVVGTARARGADGATAFTRRQAEALVRTSVSHVTNAAKREFYMDNANVFTEEVYLATLDGRTSPICRALDGNRYPIGEGPIPPVHISCRSTRVAVIDKELIGVRPAKPITRKRLLKDYAKANNLGFVESRKALPRGHKGPFDSFSRRRLRELTGSVPAATTYQQWLSGQSAQFQNDILGVAKGKLFRKGGLTLDRFVNRKGDELTLGQLVTRDRQAFLDAGLDPDDFGGGG